MRPAFASAHIVVVSAIVGLALASTGCAFLFKGGKQDVAIDSEPQHADVENNGNHLGRTPSTVAIPRTGTVNIRVSKTGYQERYVHLDRSADVPWFLWDTATCVVPVLLCIPVLTDALSGAWWKYDDSYAVKLDPVTREQPAAPMPAQTAPAPEVVPPSRDQGESPSGESSHF